MATKKVREIKSLSDLTPDSENLNMGTEQGQRLLEESLRRFGGGRSILIDRNGKVIAGNKTLEAAIAAGIENVQVVQSDGNKIIAVQRTDMDLETAEGREFALADNATGKANLKFDFTKIEEQCRNFKIDPSKWGDEFKGIVCKMNGGADAVQDDFSDDDAKRSETRVKRGDVWQCGPHRLMCGDSTDPDDVARLMDGQRADLCFTSPPYNVGGFKIGKTCDEMYLKRDSGAYNGEQSDSLSDEQYADFLNRALANALAHCDDVLFNIGCTAGAVRGTAMFVGLNAKSFAGIIAWKKSNAMMPLFDAQVGILRNIMEPIYCFNGRGNRKFAHSQWRKTDCIDNYIETKNASSTNEFSDVNKATFPVELPAYFIRNFTENITLDIFGGTGTTMIAAEQIGGGG